MLTPGNIIQWAVIALLCLAVIMVNSAAMTVSSPSITFETLLLGRPTLYAALAVFAMLITSCIDIRRLQASRGFFNPILILLILSIFGCIVVLIPGIGTAINNSRRWICIGPASLNLTFQPSELAKWAVILTIAWWAARHAGAMKRFAAGLLPPLLIVALICGLIIIEDLGTAVLIGSVSLILLLASGARIRHLALMILPALASVALLIYHSPYRVKRLLAFLDPWADPQGIGYHPIQSMIAIASGNRGLGNGIQKMGYLPADTTDFIFAIICEELGLAGAALVFTLYLVILFTSLSIIRDCRHTFGRLLALGILATLGIQAVMNIAVVTVVVPTKGIALPLLSSGGTGWILFAGALGFLVAIDRLNRLENSESVSITSDAAPPLVSPVSSG